MSHQALIGKPAPTFTLPNYDGENFTLTPGEGGLPIALFIYPKSGSFGCTKEACQFRDAIAEKDTFKPGQVRIVGISRDTVEKQKLFVEKEKLTYPVLSDVEGKALKAYKVGRGMLGMTNVARITFIIDKKGIVRCVRVSVFGSGLDGRKYQRCVGCDHALQRTHKICFKVAGQIGGGGCGCS